MTGGWRVWRPAIWAAMFGVAVVLVVNPPYLGALPIGAAIGLALRIEQRRRRAARGRGDRQPRGRPPRGRRPRGRRPR